MNKQPPYSSDLAPSDYHFLGHWKGFWWPVPPCEKNVMAVQNLNRLRWHWNFRGHLEKVYWEARGLIRKQNTVLNSKFIKYKQLYKPNPGFIWNSLVVDNYPCSHFKFLLFINYGHNEGSQQILLESFYGFSTLFHLYFLYLRLTQSASFSWKTFCNLSTQEESTWLECIFLTFRSSIPLSLNSMVQ